VKRGGDDPGDELNEGRRCVKKSSALASGRVSRDRGLHL
jgi:hypothetical protein